VGRDFWLPQLLDVEATASTINSSHQARHALCASAQWQ
jgi:hypothetical protein